MAASSVRSPTDLKIKSRYSKTITTTKTTIDIIKKNSRGSSWAPSTTQIFKDNKNIKNNNNKKNKTTITKPTTTAGRQVGLVPQHRSSPTRRVARRQGGLQPGNGCRGEYS